MPTTNGPAALHLEFGPGVLVGTDEWEQRTSDVVRELAEDGITLADFQSVLRDFTFRDEAGDVFTYDGVAWWRWDGAGWVARHPSGRLKPQPVPVQVPSARGAFRRTHVVPQGGMRAWPAPDPASEPTPVDAGIDVMLLETRDDGWARVVFSNEWEAWVDGRLLVAVRR